MKFIIIIISFHLFISDSKFSDDLTINNHISLFRPMYLFLHTDVEIREEFSICSYFLRQGLSWRLCGLRIDDIFMIAMFINCWYLSSLTLLYLTSSDLTIPVRFELSLHSVVLMKTAFGI